jgi:hypothetical protein
MLNQLLPRQINNGYSGHTLALWLFGLVLFVNLGVSLSSIFNDHHVASSADGIPLDTFSSAGANAVVSLFGLLGLWRLVFCVLSIVVLARYRAMVPLMFALLLLEHLGRRAILHAMPIARSGASPGSYVNVGLLTLIVVGLTISLMRRKTVPGPK